MLRVEPKQELLKEVSIFLKALQAKQAVIMAKEKKPETVMAEMTAGKLKHQYQSLSWLSWTAFEAASDRASQNKSLREGEIEAETVFVRDENKEPM